MSFWHSIHYYYYRVCSIFSVFCAVSWTSFWCKGSCSFPGFINMKSLVLFFLFPPPSDRWKKWFWLIVCFSFDLSNQYQVLSYILYISLAFPFSLFTFTFPLFCDHYYDSGFEHTFWVWIRQVEILLQVVCYEGADSLRVRRRDCDWLPNSVGRARFVFASLLQQGRGQGLL